MKKFLYLFLALSFSFSFSSCTKENEEVRKLMNLLLVPHKKCLFQRLIQIVSLILRRHFA